MSNSAIKNLEKLLDYTALRQKVISENIANVNTRGYKRKDVTFEDVLNNQTAGKLKVTEKKHFINQVDNNSPNSEFKIVEDKDTENYSGVNNVDINKEMAELAKNQLMFKFGAKRINAYYTRLQSVIKGGR